MKSLEEILKTQSSAISLSFDERLILKNALEAWHDDQNFKDQRNGQSQERKEYLDKIMQLLIKIS